MILLGNYGRKVNRMNVTTSVVLQLTKIVAVFTAVIGISYGFVIPAFFPNYKTYSILIIGTGIASLIGDTSVTSF